MLVFSIVFIGNCVTDGTAYEFDGQLDDEDTFEPPLPTTHTTIHKTVVKHVKVSNSKSMYSDEMISLK